MVKHNKAQVDMINGPLFKNIVIFSVPLMLMGILQLLYNTFDTIVVGRYVGPTALAAVGSTGSVINLTINVFLGLSVGAGVCVARYIGAKNNKALSEVVHTSILTSIIGGAVVGIIGICLTKTILLAMGSPPDVLPQAAIYLKIYFAGTPFNLLANYAASILKSTGDTKRPLIFIAISGIVNIVLNLIFVIFFNMGVAGVAWATIISQGVSAAFHVMALMKTEHAFRLEIKRLKIHFDKLSEIIKIGLPAGVQGALFSISNVIIQSSVNSFGSVVMAGNAAASSIEGFVYTSMNAVSQAAVTFTGQNVGAKNFKRIMPILAKCSLFVFLVGIVMSIVILLLAEPLLGIYCPGNMEAIDHGITRLTYILTTYFLCGLMEVMVGVLRGMGSSFLPMMVSVGGACGLRLLWIFTVFNALRNDDVTYSLIILFLSYPISWFITTSVHFICALVVKYRLFKREGVI